MRAQNEIVEGPLDAREIRALRELLQAKEALAKEEFSEDMCPWCGRQWHISRGEMLKICERLGVEFFTRKCGGCSSVQSIRKNGTVEDNYCG